MLREIDIIKFLPNIKTREYLSFFFFFFLNPVYKYCLQFSME